MVSISIAVISMFAALMAALLLLVTAIAFGQRAGNDMLAQIRDRLAATAEPAAANVAHARRQHVASSRRAYESARLPDAEGAPGRRDGRDDVMLDLEPTPVSPVSAAMLADMREEGHRSRMEVPPYRGPVPALGEDEERGPGWEKRSGTWTREGR